MPDALTPDQLDEMLVDPEFAALPFEQRTDLTERGIAAVSQHISQSAGWTPERWQQFGTLAQQTRDSIKSSETMLETAKRYAGVAGQAIKDLPAIIGTGVVGTSPVLPDDKGGVTGQVPLETLGPALGRNIVSLAASGAAMLSDAEQPLVKQLDTLKQQFDQGEFLKHKDGFHGWLEEQDKAMRQTQQQFYGDESWAEQNSLLGNDDNVNLMQSYLVSRSPQAWQELQDNLLRTPFMAKLQGDKQALENETELGQALQPEARGLISEAADPAEVVPGLLATKKGMQALAKGATRTQRIVEAGKGAVGEMIGEQVSASIDNPYVSAAQRLQIVKDSLAGAIGLMSAGAGVQVAANRFTANPAPNAAPPVEESEQDRRQRVGTLPPPTAEQLSKPPVEVVPAPSVLAQIAARGGAVDVSAIASATADATQTAPPDASTTNVNAPAPPLPQEPIPAAAANVPTPVASVAADVPPAAAAYTDAATPAPVSDIRVAADEAPRVLASRAVMPASHQRLSPLAAAAAALQSQRAPAATAPSQSPPLPVSPSSDLLAAAHAAAMQGSSTPMVPIRAVFEQAQRLDPTLTPEQFTAAVKQADEAGTVFLEAANSQTELQEAGGFVVADAMGGPGIRMMPAPPRVSLSRPHQSVRSTTPASAPAYFVAEATGQPIFPRHEIPQGSISPDPNRDAGTERKAGSPSHASGETGQPERPHDGAEQSGRVRADLQGLPALEAASLQAGLGNITPKIGGEHDVYLDTAHNVAVKLTRPGEFGAEEQGLDGYQARLARSNAEFNDAASVIGWVHFPGEAGPRLVHTQPLRFADAKRPEPTQKEIDVYMRSKGYLRAYEGAFLHESKDLVATDAVPKNFVHDRDGRIHAVDVIVLVPTAEQHERLTAQAYNAEQVPAEAVPGAPLDAASSKARFDQAQEALQRLHGHMPALTQNVALVPNREALDPADYHPKDWADFAGPNATEAFFDPNTGGVIVFTDNLVLRPGESQSRALVRAVLHERIGHAGLAALRQMKPKFAERWNTLVTAIEEDQAIADEIAALREQGYAHLDDSQLVEEWFARQVEKMTPQQLAALQPSSILGKLWQWLKQALEDFTWRFKGSTQWTAREIKEVMTLSQQALARGGPVGTQQAERVKQSVADPDHDQRSFGKRVRADDRLDPKMRERFGDPITYDVAHNADTLAAANDFINQHGLQAAAEALFDMQQNIPPHVRVTLGQQLLMRLDQTARAAAKQGDQAQTTALYDLAYKVSNFTDELGTQAGQTVQAFSMWARMTPEGVLMQFDKRLKDLNNGVTPTLPPALLQELGDLRDKANTLPQDSIIRTDVMRELLATMARYEGVPIGSVLGALWYANLLSGLTTQGVNVWGNGLNLIARTLAAGMVNHPRDTLAMMSGMLRAWPKAREEAIAALKGKQTSKGAVRYDLPTVDKHAQLNALEIALSEKPRNWQSWVAWIGSIGGATKFVFRALQATDAIFWHTAFEGRAHLAASRAAAQGHGRGTPEHVQAMADMLGSGTQRFEAALEQAAEELRAATGTVDPRQQRRRAWELVDKERPTAIREEGARFGDLLTYQQEPQGSGRWIYNTIQSFQNFKPFGLPVFKPLIPFARIPANIWSNGLDFTPVGILRGIAGSHLGGLTLEGKQREGAEEMAAWERKERIAAGVMGTLVGTLIWQAAAACMDDDDESADFMIYGAGRGSKDKNATMPPNWKPYTLKLGGSYWSYAETPMAFVMAPIGAWFDAKRYKLNLSEKSWSMRADYMGRTVAGAVMSQGVMSSMADLMDVISGKTPASKLPARYTSGFIPASGMLRDITPLFDPVKISDETVLSSIFRDVPVVRHAFGRPALNLFGEPVKVEGLARIPIVKRFMALEGEHPQARFLARHSLSVPGLDQYLEAGSYLTAGQKRTMQERRQSSAQHLARMEANMLTDDEHYDFVKRSGELTLEAVRQIQSAYENGGYTPDHQTYQRAIEQGFMPQVAREAGLKVTLQNKLDARVRAARATAMKELAQQAR